MKDNYFFIDGACLLNDIVRLKKEKPDLQRKKLNFGKFIRGFIDDLHYLHGGCYRRFTFYFVNGESRIQDHIEIPRKSEPTSKINADTSVSFCGKRLPSSKRVDDWIEDANPPSYVLERFHKSEKAVDTQICCDALQPAGLGKLSRLFLYTNDFDFIPLCKTLKGFGCNISLLRLRKNKINVDLTNECDSLSILPGDIVSYFE